VGGVVLFAWSESPLCLFEFVLFEGFPLYFVLLVVRVGLLRPATTISAPFPTFLFLFFFSTLRSGFQPPPFSRRRSWFFFGTRLPYKGPPLFSPAHFSPLAGPPLVDSTSVPPPLVRSTRALPSSWFSRLGACLSPFPPVNCFFFSPVLPRPPCPFVLPDFQGDPSGGRYVFW